MGYDKDRQTAANKRWLEKKKEDPVEYAIYKENRKKVNAKQYDKNRVEHGAKTKQWAEDNPDKVMNYRQRSKVRKKLRNPAITVEEKEKLEAVLQSLLDWTWKPPENAIEKQ